MPFLRFCALLVLHSALVSANCVYDFQARNFFCNGVNVELHYRQVKIYCESSVTDGDWYLGIGEGLRQMKIENGLDLFDVSCYEPSVPFKDLFQEYNLTEVDSLVFKSYSNDTATNPRLFEDLPFLLELDLTNNCLSEFPSLELTRKLKYLYLDGNNLTNLRSKYFDPLEELTHLNLGNNNISYVDDDVFRKLKKLRLLNAHRNKNGNWITKKILANIPHLKSLDINSNNISILEDGLFDDMASLQDLNLCYNNFKMIDENSFINLNQLVRLRMVDTVDPNFTFQLPSGLFSNLSSLETLKLSSNYLKSLPETLFSNTVSLIELYLDRNNLTYLSPKIFSNITKLEMLSLEYNNIDSINDQLFMPLKNLDTLWLNNNRLSSLKGIIFSGLKKLSNLQLNNNHIHVIESSASTVFRNLRTIDLSNNFFKSLDAISFLKNSSRLETLNLENNSISEVGEFDPNFGRLRTLNLQMNNFTKLHSEDLKKLIKYGGNVLLDSNNIETIDFKDMGDFELRSSSSNFVRISVAQNPIKCDCESYDFIYYAIQTQNSSSNALLNVNGALCHQPVLFANLSILELDLEQLSCTIQQISPVSCSDGCSCIYYPVTKKLAVDCANKSMDKVPKDVPYDRKIENIAVDISNNEIDSLMTDAFENVTSIDASYNRVTQFPLVDSLNLQMLKLDHNYMTRLDSDVLKMLRKLDLFVWLGHNPWACDCDTVPFFDFLKTHYQKIPDLENVTCSGTNMPINKLSEDYLCDTSLSIAFGCILIAISGLICGILMVTYHRHEHEIKVWLFARSMYPSWIVTADDETQYDAFISYASPDEHFVAKYLVPELEQEPNSYKLCVHYRDWLVGDMIQAQIARSVENSRKTVVILSRHFVNSDWGQWEFKMAHRKSIEENRTRVIVVLLHELDPTDKVDPQLKAYLDTHTYLERDDPWFWDKLRYALRRPTEFHLSKIISRGLKKVQKFFGTKTATMEPEVTLKECKTDKKCALEA